MATVAPDPKAVLAELEAADRLLVQQLFKPIANEYVDHRLLVAFAVGLDALQDR